jgi:hypothetical protein
MQDFAAFLKERSILEEKHANGLKRLAQNSHSSSIRPESRQGTFAQGYQEIARSHERVAEHGLTFSNTLFAMADELHELANTSEKGRKHWKQTGLNSEKRVQDAQFAMEKAKAKYNTLAEQYDRVRTGERAGGKFGLKKSAAQEEENLHRKLEVADGDYSFKVQAAQTMQQELLTTLRPQAVNALQELIFETDAGLAVHVQKFAAQSEKLLLGYGLSITPMKGQNPAGGPPAKSLRELASSINNDKDFADYVLSLSNKASPRPNEIKYEQHPTLGPKQQTQNQYTQDYDRDSYGQNYPSNHNRQVSGVTSFQDSSYEDSGYGYPGSGPQSQQYQQGNQGLGQNYAGPPPSQPSQPPSQQRQASMDYPSAPSTAPSQAGSGAPQLPQIDSGGSDRFSGQTSGVISSLGPGTGSTAAPGQNDQNDQSSYSAPLGQNNAPPGAAGLTQGPQGQTGAPGPGPGTGARPPGAMRQPSSESQPAGPGPAGRGAGPPSGSQYPGGPGGPGGPAAGPRPTGPTQGAGRGAPGGPTGAGRGTPPGAGRGAPPGAGRGGPPGAGRGAPPGAGRGAPPGAGRGAPPGSGPRPTGPPGAGRGAPGPGAPSAAGPRPAGNGPPGAGRGAPTQGPSQGPSQPPPNGAPRSQGGPGPVPQNVATAPPQPGFGAGGPNAVRGPSPPKSTLPPLKPVFGVSLDDLFQREGSAVPTIVYQCIQAVDLYGLETEGIYRTSGSAHHIMELRQQFDHGKTANSVSE